MSDEGRQPPCSFYERAKVEQAFRNAFKAIDAHSEASRPQTIGPSGNVSLGLGVTSIPTIGSDTGGWRRNRSSTS